MGGWVEETDLAEEAGGGWGESHLPLQLESVLYLHPSHHCASHHTRWVGGEVDVGERRGFFLLLLLFLLLGMGGGEAAGVDGGAERGGEGSFLLFGRTNARASWG